MTDSNPYLQQCHAVLPRLLALYDTNPISHTYGLGDRLRWAWKLIDFGNGTFQGAANGLARLLVHHLLPENISERSVIRRIDAMFKGTAALTRPNGSLEEAFPYEASFCVTALIAYDLLTAIELLGDRLVETQRKDYFRIIRPLIHFLRQSKESHALISNHLATAATALFKWSVLTGEDGSERGKEILNRILKEQSIEGWFREYEGADPGYQSLCTYYLADLHHLQPGLSLGEPLTRSLQFLFYFAHLDGSFGGMYGSRNTRFYCPAGIEAVADNIPEAAALSGFMRKSISEMKTVTLSVLDEPNLVPMFNAYCWAAAIFQERQKNGITKNGSPPKTQVKQLPCFDLQAWRKHFPEAGILIDKGVHHYTIISYHKGGVCYHFPSDAQTMVDTGVLIKDKGSHYYSTQAYRNDNDVKLSEDTIEITSQFSKEPHSLPSPSQMIILRMLNITIMRNLAIGNFIKKLLVRLLITGKKSMPIKNIRTITLGQQLCIRDQIIGNINDFEKVETDRPFSMIHMASQGYWQVYDDQ